MRIIFFAVILLCYFVPTLTFATEPMKIVYYDSYPPRSWQEDGQMKGILIDIITEALQNRMGIKLVHEGYPWARAQAMVEAGQADAFITVPTPKRRIYTEVSTEPVIKLELFISTQVDNPKLAQLKTIKTIAELKPYRIVDYYGNGFLEQKLKGFNVERVPGIDAVYPFLAAGKAEVLLLSGGRINSIKKMGYQNKIVVLPQPIYSMSFNLCISKKSPYKNILTDFDLVIRQMATDGFIQKVHEKYCK